MRPCAGRISVSNVSKTIVNQSGNRLRYGVSAAILTAAAIAPAFAQEVAAPAPLAAEPAPEPQQTPGPQAPNATVLTLTDSDRIVVTARRVEEDVQEVPIAVSVLNEGFLADSGAFNVGKLNQLVPSVQFYSTNPRNSQINI